jgi:hypothetical protein
MDTELLSVSRVRMRSHWLVLLAISSTNEPFGFENRAALSTLESQLRGFP